MPACIEFQPQRLWNAYSLITVFLQPLSIRLDSFLLISRALENEIYFFSTRGRLLE